ncbi:MAG: 3-phosphoshikimate 1-carboxyvinyltransferase [Leifsonia sp.]|nr:3-phosphoshikimate 1-carboxyvinyltransferase [Leifsonia sp.]|tara:strand:+ start:28740 stop:30137 length:1398 start_codon:yes stop_codon:yes gene_type:complete
MGFISYSGRDEQLSPVSDSAPGPWRAPLAAGPLDVTLTLPGSKSLTNRELVLAALADGPSLLRRPLHSRDSALMIEALRQLGVGIEEVAGDGEFGPDLRITPAELRGAVAIDCGLAGTVMRFVPPLAALALGPVSLDGDPHARARPMRTTIQALRDLGVEVSDDGRAALPFTIHATGRVAGGELAIDASASSQFVSGLLLAAPRFEAGLTLRHTGDRLPSMPHIEMTIHTLAERGVVVDSPEPGVWVVPAAPIAARDVTIEPDLSNAGPFLAAALVAGGRVAIAGWPRQTTQVGDELPRLLAGFGATVTREHDHGTDTDTVVVDGGSGVRGGAALAAHDLDLTIGGELAPTIAGLAALADGAMELSGIGHLRGHETDRLAALADDLAALGGAATVLDEGLRITPQPMLAGPWRAFADHRMATTGALLGLVVDGVEVDDITSTAKTLPEFPELWSKLVASAGSPSA